MPQVINESTFGGNIGAALGTGLSTGLSQLANLKLNQMLQKQQAQRTASGLQALGLAPAEATNISRLPAALQSDVIKNYLSGAENLGLQQALSGVTGQPLQPESFGPLRVDQLQQPQPGISSGLEALGVPRADAIAQQELAAPKQQVEQVVPSQFQSVEQVDPLPPQVPTEQPIDRPTSLANVLTRPRLKPEHALKIAELQQKKEEAGTKLKSEAFKETQVFRKEVLAATKSAKQNLQDLNRMQELEKTGKLDTPGYVAFLKSSGFDIPALMNPESQEFQKIAQTFMRDAKKYLGGNISNFELEQFLKTVPSLSQSPEGRKRVIANLKRVNRGAIEQGNAIKKVMAANQGVPPLDIMERVDDVMETKMAEIAAKFKKDLALDVPDPQAGLKTALQSAIGSTIGFIPSALKSAATLLTGKVLLGK